MQKPGEISEANMDIMHDLITNINKNYSQMEDDIRDLNNLIHFIIGDGVRTVEFTRRHKK
jgi:hypothetical protein